MDFNWNNFWQAIVSNSYTPIPGEGCLVFYLPNIHAQHGGFNFDQESLLCRINNVQLGKSDTNHLRVRYNLHPVRLEDYQVESARYMNINPAAGGQVFMKALTYNDRNSGNCVLGMNIFHQLFGAHGPHMVNLGFMNESIYRLFGLSWQRNRISSGWATLRNDVGGFHDGDSLILYQMADGEVRLGVRRFAPHPNPINQLDLFSAVVDWHMGWDFELVYYPHVNNQPFVVSIEDYINGSLI